MTTLIDVQSQTGDPTRFLSDEQREFVNARRAVCNTCDSKRRLTALTINCRSCGCAGLSLLNGRCHLGKWPANDAQRTQGDISHQADVAGNGNRTVIENPLPSRDQASPQTDIHQVVVRLEHDAETYRRSTPNVTSSGSRKMPPVIDRIAVVGHPSKVGGADTELDHQIRCWQTMGIEVHLCPTHSLDVHLRSMRMEERRCIYHEPRDWASLKGMHCISYCNGEFLKNLEQIKKYVKTTTFVNCMTWNFPLEIEAQRRGLIDFHLYQTDHAMKRVGEALAATSSTYRPLRVTPYFHADDFPYIDNRPQETFRFGRISRPDADKYNSRQMWIYETMTAPALKEGLIVGWDDRAERKVGKPPSYIKTYLANGVTQQAFYRFCDAIIMSTDTYENLPRVGFEAMASGSVLVVDDRRGWREQVEQGELQDSGLLLLRQLEVIDE